MRKNCSASLLSFTLSLAAGFIVVPLSLLSAQEPEKPLVVEAKSYTSVPAQAPYSRDSIGRFWTPDGFTISVFADNLGGPRMMAVGDNGTVYVTRRDSGDVLAITTNNPTPTPVVTGLPGVHGITIHQNKLYLATVQEVYVADIKDGVVGKPTVIITDLPEGGQHPNRTISVGPDGMLYISIGSTCNQCIETNEEHAAILQATLDGKTRTIHAQGLRNTIGYGWHPSTGVMWGMDHGSDGKGNDKPSEELNRIVANQHYGWPFCYENKQVDSSFAQDPEGTSKEAFCPTTVAPVLTYQAHSSPIGLVFYTGTSFPEKYRNGAFAVMRGSWNRHPPTGYKLLYLSFDEDGNPVKFEDFVTGFLSEDGKHHYGRIAGVAIAADGSLLLSDDTNGVIYRITYSSSAAD